MKKLFYGLMVAVAAISFSAFTVAKDAEKRSSLRAGEIWVNTTNAGDYVQLSNPSSFNPDDCLDDNSHICAFERTNVDPGVTLPEEMDQTQINQALLDGQIQQVTAKKGVYDGF